MAFNDRVVDLAAANRLQISITTITPAQAWKRQVRGAYHFIYPYAIKDFVHREDFFEWLRNDYMKHQHIGNKGRPTSAPRGTTIFSNEKARALLQKVPTLGYVRTGITTIIQAIRDIYRTNTSRLS